MYNTKSLIHIIFVLFVLVLCVSCGVSSSSTASSPTSNHSPATDDPTQNYFSFQTDAAANFAAYGSSGYMGVAIYYKIYTNASNIITHYNTINAESTGAGGKSKLESYGYQWLNGSQYVIPSSDKNQNVEIRLIDETAYSKELK